MITIRHFLALLLLALSGHSIAASTSEDDFHLKVTAIYSFEPRLLKEPELKAKSDQLDAFWSSIKENPEKNLPFLRKELTDASNSAFFSYDGARLLLSLSKEKNDQALALRAISKTDLRSVQHTDYLKNVHWFASNGFDAREAAFRILAFPDFQAFIPQHVLTLGQNYSLIYMLFPMDESRYVDDLVRLLATETNAKSQKSLLLALWYTVTPTGKAALKQFAEDSRNSAESRSYVNALITQKPSGWRTFSISSEASLREQRKDIMRRPISDEALMELDELTAKLLAKQ